MTNEEIKYAIEHVEYLARCEENSNNFYTTSGLQAEHRRQIAELRAQLVKLSAGGDV